MLPTKRKKSSIHALVHFYPCTVVRPGFGIPTRVNRVLRFDGGLHLYAQDDDCWIPAYAGMVITATTAGTNPPYKYQL